MLNAQSRSATWRNSASPPVRFKGQVWIRVGPRRAVASESEERRLTERRVSHARTFDARPCRDSSVTDLAADLFLTTYRQQAVAEDVIASNRRELKQQLAALRFFDIANDCPTHAGILLFAKNPRFYWFYDRIEVQNPGSLYGEASRENFPRQNAYRNPVIAEAMKTLGYVNRYGSGVERAQEALKTNSNPPAAFSFEDTYFLVTAKTRP